MSKASTDVRTALIAFLKGCLAAACFERSNLFPVFFFCIIALGFLLDRTRGRKSFSIAYSFGFGFFLTGTWWLGMVRNYWFLPLLLAFYEAFFFAVPAYLSSELFHKKSDFRFIALYSGIFVFEILRGAGSFGFPWMSAGFYLSETPLKGLLLSYGIYGSSFVIYLAAAVFSSLFFSRKKVLFIVLALLIMASVFLSLRLPQFEEIGRVRVALLQDSMLPEEKHAKDLEERRRIIEEHFFKMADKVPQETSLVVFPETSFPRVYPFNAYFDGFLKSMAEKTSSYLFIGTESHEEGRFYNSIVVYDRSGPVAKYDKVHLVPFGEYVPYRERLRFFPIVRDSTDFSRGKNPGIIRLKNFTAGVGICWESAIPRTGRSLALQGANLLVFVTNDNWFGFSNQSNAHWRHTKAQADSTGISVVQSANAGITGFYTGERERTLLTWTLDVLSAEIPLRRPKRSILEFQRIFEFACLSFSAAAFAFLCIKKG